MTANEQRLLDAIGDDGQRTRSRALRAEGMARWLEHDADQDTRSQRGDAGDQAQAWMRAGEAWHLASRLWSEAGGVRGHKGAERCSRHASECDEMAADLFARWLTANGQADGLGDEPPTPLDDEYGWEADSAALRAAETGGYERCSGL